MRTRRFRFHLISLVVITLEAGVLLYLNLHPAVDDIEVGIGTVMRLENRDDYPVTFEITTRQFSFGFPFKMHSGGQILADIPDDAFGDLRSAELYFLRLNPPSWHAQTYTEKVGEHGTYSYTVVEDENGQRISDETGNLTYKPPFVNTQTRFTGIWHWAALAGNLAVGLVIVAATLCLMEWRLRGARPEDPESGENAERG